MGTHIATTFFWSSTDCLDGQHRQDHCLCCVAAFVMICFTASSPHLVPSLPLTRPYDLASCDLFLPQQAQTQRCFACPDDVATCVFHCLWHHSCTLQHDILVFRKLSAHNQRIGLCGPVVSRNLSHTVHLSCCRGVVNSVDQVVPVSSTLEAKVLLACSLPTCLGAFNGLRFQCTTAQRVPWGICRSFSTNPSTGLQMNS